MELFDKTDPNWPPDPATIDLSDPVWITAQQAAGLMRCSLRSMHRILKKRERDISIMPAGRRYIHRGRLMGRA